MAPAEWLTSGCPHDWVPFAKPMQACCRVCGECVPMDDDPAEQRALGATRAQAILRAADRVENARDRVVKAALHWSEFQTSTARARDLGLACNRLAEAERRLTELKQRAARQPERHQFDTARTDAVH